MKYSMSSALAYLHISASDQAPVFYHFSALCGTFSAWVKKQSDSLPPSKKKKKLLCNEQVISSQNYAVYMTNFAVKYVIFISKRCKIFKVVALFLTTYTFMQEKLHKIINLARHILKLAKTLLTHNPSKHCTTGPLLVLYIMCNWTYTVTHFRPSCTRAFYNGPTLATSTGPMKNGIGPV